MERLSKPTAASASKVRAPAVTASPLRKTSVSMSGGGGGGGATVSRAGTKVIKKPKSAIPLGETKEGKEKGRVVSEGDAAGKDAGVEDVVVSQDVVGEDHKENGTRYLDMGESGAVEEGTPKAEPVISTFAPLVLEPEPLPSHEEITSATQDILPIERPCGRRSCDVSRSTVGGDGSRRRRS
jgi:hypothetical protein